MTEAEAVARLREAADTDFQTGDGPYAVVRIPDLTLVLDALESRAGDTARLDYLDAANRRLNIKYGTQYGWRLIMNHNVNRLLLGNDSIDLHDTEGGIHKLASCRAAIDEWMTRPTAPPPTPETGTEGAT